MPDAATCTVSTVVLPEGTKVSVTDEASTPSEAAIELASAVVHVALEAKAEPGSTTELFTTEVELPPVGRGVTGTSSTTTAAPDEPSAVEAA